MKTSELIKHLQELVDEGHDVDIFVEALLPQIHRWDIVPIELVTHHSCTDENIIMLKY